MRLPDGCQEGSQKTHKGDPCEKKMQCTRLYLRVGRQLQSQATREDTRTSHAITRRYDAG